MQNKRKTSNLLKYTAISGLVIGSSIGINLINVSAKGYNGGGISPSSPDYYVNQALSNALHAWGVENPSENLELFNFSTPDGQQITKEYLESNNYSNELTMKITYKDPAMAQAFGNNIEGLNHVITSCGGNYEQILNTANQVNNLVSQLGQAASNVKGGDGQSILTPVIGEDGSVTFVTNGNANGITNEGKANLEKYNEIVSQLKDLLGNDSFNSLSASDIQILLNQAGKNEDVNIELKPATDSYTSLSKIRITVTDENGYSIGNVDVNQAATVALFKQYNPQLANVYSSMQGSLPPLTKINATTFEMNFTGPFKEDWKKKVDKWNTRKTTNQVLGVANLTTRNSSNKIKVKVDIFVDRLSYTEKIANGGVYPTGNNGITSPNGYDYTFENYKNSFYFYDYKYSVNEYTGQVYYRYSAKVPNEKRVVKHKPVYEWNRELGRYTYVREKYYLSTEGPYCTKYSTENGGALHEVGSGTLASDRPLYSVDDGTYVRDIWFKTQQYRYWDYKERPLIGAEAGYPQYIMSKYSKSTVRGQSLITFANEADRRMGKIKTTPLTNIAYRKPDRVENDKLIRTQEWVLAPINGVIEIPVKAQIGNIQGVINDVEW